VLAVDQVKGEGSLHPRTG